MTIDQPMMQAVTWQSANHIKVTSHPIPTILQPGDAIVRITLTTICGSDLHLYHGVIPEMKPGDILGHEAVGVITALGSDTDGLQVGQRVAISAMISCGQCEYCHRQEFSLCNVTNPVTPLVEMMGAKLAGVFGYSHLTGGYPGLQAEYARVPFAKVNLLVLPDMIRDEEAIFLSDVLCTAYHGVSTLGEVQKDDVVAVWGCGPVGLMVQACARLRGAKRVIAIDRIDFRLALAREKFGSEIIHLDQHSDVFHALRELVPEGPDVVVDAVGVRYTKTMLHRLEQAFKMETESAETLAEALKCVRKGGRVAILGDYIGFANHFPVGALMEKGLTVRGGQVYVQRYWHELLKLLMNGELDPTVLITHRMTLDQAVEAYEMFDRKEDEAIKIMLSTPPYRVAIP